MIQNTQGWILEYFIQQIKQHHHIIQQLQLIQIYKHHLQGWWHLIHHLHQHPITITSQIKGKKECNVLHRNIIIYVSGTHFRQQSAQYLLAQQVFQQSKVMHIYDDNGRKLSMGDLIKGPQGKTWAQALNNEWGRLAQGDKKGILSTNTIEFIEPSKIPAGKKLRT